MRIFVIPVCVVIIALSFASPAEAVTPSFQGLGHLPANVIFGDSFAEEVSADGTTVVGYNHNNDQTGIFRWTAGTGMVEISQGARLSTNPIAISADGSAIFGTTSEGVGLPNVFRWTENSGKEILWAGEYVCDVSADGSVVVGDFHSGDSYQANRWTDAQGLIPMGYLPGHTYSSATGISADGSVIVGYSGGSGSSELFRWTDGDGMVDLGTLAGATGIWDPAVSADGSVVAGESGGELFRWTEDTGMVGLGTLSGADNMWVRDMSADGSIIVGTCNMTNGGSEGFVWDAAGGIQNAEDYLTAHGVDLDVWSLRRVSGISADGTVLVGIGQTPYAHSEAWMATIPEPTSLCMLALGGLAVLRRRK